MKDAYDENDMRYNYIGDWYSLKMPPELNKKNLPLIVSGKALDTQVGGTHYKHFVIQPVEYCYRNKLNNLESEIISYVSRHRFKWVNNKEMQLEDLNKAKHSIDLLIDFIKNEAK